MTDVKVFLIHAYWCNPHLLIHAYTLRCAILANLRLIIAVGRSRSVKDTLKAFYNFKNKQENV